MKTRSVRDKRSKKQKQKTEGVLSKVQSGITSTAAAFVGAGLINLVNQGDLPVCSTALVEMDKNTGLAASPFAMGADEEARANPNEMSSAQLVNIGDIQLIENESEWSLDPAGYNNFDEYIGVDQASTLVVPSSTPTSSHFPAHGLATAASLVNQGASAEFNLQDAYLTYDVRESYLQRHANAYGMQADQTYLQTDEFATKTCNLWRSSDYSLFPGVQNAQLQDSFANYPATGQEKVRFNSAVPQILSSPLSPRERPGCC